MKRDKHIGFRLDSEIHAKMVYIAAYEGRSLSWQIIHLMQECIRNFEKEHGVIQPEDMKQ